MTTGDGENSQQTANQQSAIAAAALLTGELNAVSIRIPPFWTNLPLEWFCQVEAQFATRGITTQLTKYNWVLPAIPQDVVATVSDVIKNPGEHAYNNLKKALIDRHKESNSQSLEKLLSGTQIGDRKPSEFYRHMKSLADNANIVNDGLLSQLWLRQLPVLIQAAVTSSGKTEVDGLLEVADKVYEVYQQQSLQMLNTPINPSTPNISELVAQNNRLLNELAEIRTKFDRMNGSRGRSRDRSRSRSRNRSEPSNGGRNLCWYHFKYGANARKCQQPCNFINGARANSAAQAGASGGNNSNNPNF